MRQEVITPNVLSNHLLEMHPGPSRNEGQRRPKKPEPTMFSQTISHNEYGKPDKPKDEEDQTPDALRKMELTQTRLSLNPNPLSLTPLCFMPKWTTMPSSPNPVRFAYVGCGFVGQTIHIPNFASLPECQFMAIAEVRPELAREVAARYNIPKVYRSHEEIAADPDIEAVGVSGPYSLQGKIAEDLLRAGKHVFMEKPMAVSVKRAESMIAAVRAGKGRLMVGYMKRYDTGNILLKKHLDAWKASGECGRIMLARNHGFGGNWQFGADPNIVLTRSTDAPPQAPGECPEWMPAEHQNRYLDFLQQWTHNINLLRFFLGDDGGKTKLVQAHLDPDGMTGLTILDINGTRAVIESGYIKYHGWDEHTQIYFEGGWLKTAAPPLVQKEVPATVEIYRAADGDRPARLTEEFATPTWSYREEAKHFLASVRSGDPFRSSAEDTLNDVRIFEEIYRQVSGVR
jgi:predicted dehydrogenase